MSNAEPISAVTADLSQAKRRLLKKYVRGNLGKLADDPLRIMPRPLDKPAPLSLLQEQVWLRGQETANLPPFYNESIIIHRHGPLDARLLERSLSEIIRRHEIWRTTYDTVEGKPVQVIHSAPTTFPLAVVDLGEWPVEKREPEAVRVATEEARKRFDLQQGPLVRAKLITLSPDKHQLVLTMHQSVADGITVNVLFPRELIALYNALAAGQASPMADLPIQYADFAHWQRQRMQAGAWISQLAYWRKQLTPQPSALQWPSDYQRPASPAYRGAIRAFTIPQQLTEELNAVSRSEGVTLFMTLLTSFSTLLHYYTGEKDIVLGTLAPSGRERSEVQQLIGYFLNPLPLRVDLSGNPTFREMLRRVRTVVSGALANDDLPLEYLWTELGISSDPYAEPLLDLVISLAPATGDLGAGWSQTFMDVESGGSRWDLYLELGERPGGLIGRAQYNPDRFAPATITRTLNDWQVVLQGAASNPQSRLSELTF
jgi:Condensation domain